MSDGLQSLRELIAGRQHNRILRLSFPGNDGPSSQLLVDKLDAFESLSRDFDFTVELLSDNACLELKDLQGKLLCVEMVRSNGTMRHFSGYVYEFRLRRVDGALAFYEARLGPWARYLSLRKDNYLFHNKSLREQTTMIFQDYGTHAVWDWRVIGDDAPMTDACQFGESDFNYLSRRWEAAGWSYFYEHAATGHQLVLIDDTTRAALIDGGADVPYQRHGGSYEEDGIGEWSPVRQWMPGSVAVARFDFKNPARQSQNISAVPTVSKQGAVLDIESYEYAGAYGFKNRQDGDRLAKLRMEEMEAAGKHFEGAGNNRYMMPGRWFHLVGHFDDSLAVGERAGEQNAFLILEVRHAASNNYLQGADGPAGYSNRLRCIRKAIPWRPGRNFNSVDTRILAPQTASVVGPAGPDSIHVDKYGRVRIQFHWDRVGEYDDRSSAWVRVAGLWAGSELGAAAIPRVGSEVLVAWLDGNPDHPIITGAIHNQRNMPPWALSTQQALTGLRSRELKANGGNAASGRSNHLILDDTNGKIQAQLRSDHQHSQLSLGHITRIQSNAGRQDARGEGWELRSDGNGALRSGKGMLISTEARAGAQSHITDIGEPLRRLTTARDQHERFADFAQQLEAQEKNADQSAVARAIKEQNEALKGGGEQGELAAPHLLVAAAAGIEGTTPKSIHLASGEHTALTTGGHVSLSVGERLLASVKGGIRLFAHQMGMKLIAAAGVIEIKALTDAIKMIAKLDIEIISTTDKIRIYSTKTVEIGAGDSFTVWKPDSIVDYTQNRITFANFSAPGPKMMPGSVPQLPEGKICTKCMQNAANTAGTLSKIG
ncbi:MULTISPECIES: type VI secretion system Vgr family protein [unclassified Janthinobacterium]|uniref:type VI secretion system Vgr family protein n=1 Tax=unclassified Janthinobacterium TaxID=2610881 RepID=UPI00034DBE00|nr:MULTISPECIES: type VI secretion system Vgr family protein [unclassified Janthinobacterium]MEC5159134.1 type VI secretion system secreted protein VgrG [Janthinobacterium sp. CG_S6]